MIVIFDFDRTLFNTKKFFEEDLPDLIGVDRKKFMSFNDLAENTEQAILFDPKKHLQKLRKDNTRTNEMIKVLFKKADKYLLPGALKLLRTLKKRGLEMYLVTAGSKAWQKRKVNHVKSLNAYFDTKHKIFTGDKARAVKFLKKSNKKIIIINDKPKESAEMEKAIGRHCRIYIVSSKYSENSNYGGKIFKDLFQLRRELVKNLFKNNN